MRSLLLSLLLLTTLAAGATDARDWTFAQRAGGDGNDYADRVAVDRNGTSYVLGVCPGAMKFGTVTLDAPGRWNLYVAAYDAQGRFLYARVIASAMGTASDIYAGAIALDANGHIYIGGRFEGDAVFAGVGHQSLGPSDMYLAKLSLAGDLLWVRTPGGVGVGSFGRDGITGLGIDAAGNCYVAGHYNTDAAFDTIKLSSTLTYEAFVAKYDSDGNAVWARSATNFGATHIALGLAADRDGNTWVTGKFFNRLTFGDDTLDAVDAEQKAFIVKYDRDGRERWAKEIGSGGYYGAGQDIAVDADGNAFVTGQFRAGITFEDTVYSYGGTPYSGFIVTYDREGKYLWSRQTGGVNQGVGATSIATDGSGGVFVAGSFRDTVVFDGIALASGSGRASAYIAHLSASGSTIDALRLAGGGTAIPLGLALDAAGDCTVTGTFTDSLDIGSFTLHSSGAQDIFVARLGHAPASVDGPDATTANALLIVPNPARDAIRLSGIGIHASDRIRIYAADGRLVLETAEPGRITVSGLTPGVYLVRAGGRTGRFILTGN